MSVFIRWLLLCLLVAIGVFTSAQVHAANIFEDVSSLYLATEKMPAREKVAAYTDMLNTIDNVLADGVVPGVRTRLIKARRTLHARIFGLLPQVQKQIWSGGSDFTDRYTQLDIQSRALSCESSALSSVFTRFGGQSVSEDEVIASLPGAWIGGGKSRRGNIWWDPRRGFVGDINGEYKSYTGYGIHAEGLMPIIKQKGLRGVVQRKTSQMSAATGAVLERMTQVLARLEKGDSVIIWGDWCTDPAVDDGVLPAVTQLLADDYALNARNSCSTWNASKASRLMRWNAYDENGQKYSVSVTNGDHVFLLLGWKGERSNPTHIIVWDTATGRHVFPIKEWLRKWSLTDEQTLFISQK